MPLDSWTRDRRRAEGSILVDLTWLNLAAPLSMFGVVTFAATWWLRGRGSGESWRKPR